MIKKSTVDNMAVFGGERLFSTPKSTSNLLQPNIDKFLDYSRVFFDQYQYTNNGPNVKLLEKKLAEFHDAEYCVSFSSGFWALALAIRALALPRRTEIIMPSLTYRRMADIASWVNLKPHFCEVEQSFLSMSAETVEPCINANTAIILAAHPIVNCADVEQLTSLANKYKIPILFDSVESVYETTSSGKIGTFGDAECFSLHACKLFNGFGGGYLTTNNEKLAIRVASMRTFGFTAKDTVTFTHSMNAKLNEIHAAMTLASLDDIEHQVNLNRERYNRYRSGLKALSGIRLLEFNEEYKTGYKNIVVELTKDWPLTREDTIAILNAENILARAYYHPPLHRKKMDYPHIISHLPVTDDLANRFLNLPCGQLVDTTDIQEILDFLTFIARNSLNINQRLKRPEADE
jgi:dTDP-4-amino-4,6-dideoxygalactose transaminase